MWKGVISQMFDLGNMVLHLIPEAKGMDEVEEWVAAAVFELGIHAWRVESVSC